MKREKLNLHTVLFALAFATLIGFALWLTLALAWEAGSFFVAGAAMSVILLLWHFQHAARMDIEQYINEHQQKMRLRERLLNGDANNREGQAV